MVTELTPESLRQAADHFRTRYEPGTVRGVLVAGSGLRLEVPGWQASDEIDLGTVMPFRIHDLQGHRQTMTLWRRNGESLVVFNGRFHLYQGYSPAEVVAPIRIAGLLGAETLVATNATGSLDPEIAAGTLVVVSDHLNLQGSNPLVGSWGSEYGSQFPDMSDVYDPALRAAALNTARDVGFEAIEGVYAAVLGPSFETPAEVRMLQKLGGTVVGMSTVPEVIAARHLGMRILVLSLAANPAAGLVDRPLTADEVYEVAAQANPKLARMLGLIVEEIFR